MKQQLIFFVVVTFFPAFNCMAQFSGNIEQSYLLYNKARIFEAAGHIDSAASYMKKSIRLNGKNGVVRDFAWKVFLESHNYRDAIEDIKEYYSKNTLPDKAEDVFYFCDKQTLETAKKSKEIKEFLAAYEDLKKINRLAVKTDKEFKQTIDNCIAIDYFVRTYPINNSGAKCDTQEANKLIYYADSTNMESVASFIRKNGFPSSVELDAETLTGHFVILIQHFLQNSSVYPKYPVRKYLDSVIVQAVYSGIFPTRYYLHILDRRSFVETETWNESRQLFGTWTDRTTDPATKKNIRIYNPEIDDIAHVDERRRKWMEPTLYEESLINTEIRLPEKYYHN